MYRVFCESYESFKRDIGINGARAQLARPLELLTDVGKYRQEKEKNSQLYQETNQLLKFLKENVSQYPRTKVLLWEMEDRGIKANGDELFHAKECSDLQKNKLETLRDQAKLITSFAKLAYWGK